MNKDPFKEYIKESEPAKRDNGYAWHTAIDLQAADGLKTSEYLTHTAIRNIEGEISSEEANVLLFTGIYSHVGRIRNYNITKKEWVLNGATVFYGSATELRATLDYDFSEEKKFSCKNLSMDEIIRRLVVFIFGLGQIHVFSDGNITRQYLEMFWKSL